MKKTKDPSIFLLIIFSFLIANLSSVNDYLHPRIIAQVLRNDSLVTGKFYKVIGKAGTTCEGDLIKYDSLGLVIKTQNQKNLNIEWELVRQILDKKGSIVYNVIEKDSLKNSEDSLIVFNSNYHVLYGNSIECDIFIGNYTHLKDVRIIETGDSTFKIMKNNISKEYNMSDLKKIRIIHHGFWSGVAVASVVSTVFAIVLASNEVKQESEWKIPFPILFGLYEIVYGIPTCVVGGIIGEVMVQDTDYNFNNLSINMKSIKLKILLHDKLKDN